MARTTRKDEIELAKAEAKMVTRTLVGLNLRVLRQRILNELIPDIDEAVDQAIAEGKDWQFDVHKLVADLDNRMTQVALEAGSAE